MTHFILCNSIQSKKTSVSKISVKFSYLNLKDEMKNRLEVRLKECTTTIAVFTFSFTYFLCFRLSYKDDGISK
jgi:hypothetical protein